jgi:hypothetical protein
MTKRETFEILKKIAVYYDQFVVDQEKLNLWHQVLKSFSFEEILQNLFSFVRDGHYPPKVADLIPKSGAKPTIPSPDETKVILTTRLPQASPEVVQRELANIREILGIVRG